MLCRSASFRCSWAGRTAPNFEAEQLTQCDASPLIDEVARFYRVNLQDTLNAKVVHSTYTRTFAPQHPPSTASQHHGLIFVFVVHCGLRHPFQRGLLHHLLVYSTSSLPKNNTDHTVLLRASATLFRCRSSRELQKVLEGSTCKIWGCQDFLRRPVEHLGYQTCVYPGGAEA